MEAIRLPVEAPGGFRGALRHTAFRNIWFAQLASQLGDKFLLFSLIILAYNISHGSTPVAVTLLAYTVPAVLLAPPARVIAACRLSIPMRAILLRARPRANPRGPACQRACAQVTVKSFKFSRTAACDSGAAPLNPLAGPADGR